MGSNNPFETDLLTTFYLSGPADLELNLSPDFKRKYDEWQKMKHDQAHPNLNHPESG